MTARPCGRAGMRRASRWAARTEKPIFEGRELLMLVLSRKLGEKIVIGERVVLTVVKVDRNQVRLGIEAPADVPVFREEIAPAKRAAELMACPT
jgi:carbon storage regulator